MNTKAQSSLLKEEMLAVLSELKDNGGFYKLLLEPLKGNNRGLADGKIEDHLWPLLPLLISEAVCGNFKRLLPAAACLQFFMAAGDVFDDIEDGDNSESLSARYGDAIANNVATTLVMLAELAITRLRFTGMGGENVVRIAELINKQYLKACAGQHLDLGYASDLSISEDAYFGVVKMKSSSQIECGCRVGVIGADGRAELSDIFAGFGDSLGMAAQLTNDVDGAITCGDITSRKITLPVIFALSHTNRVDRSRLQDYYKGGDGSRKSVSMIRDILFGSGAVHYTTVKMELYKCSSWDYLNKAEKLGINVSDLKTFLG